MNRFDMDTESPSEVPTLHVLFTRPHDDAVVTRPFPSGHSSVRTDLITWIAEEALGGDLESAEWMLLATIGRV